MRYIRLAKTIPKLWIIVVIARKNELNLGIGAKQSPEGPVFANLWGLVDQLDRPTQCTFRVIFSIADRIHRSEEQGLDIIYDGFGR